MIKIGDHVRVRPYKRLRTIFDNGEYSPGEWYTKTGYTGTVYDIYDDGYGGCSYVIKSDKPRGPRKIADISYIEHPAEEIELG